MPRGWIILALWYFSGMAGFMFWWTRRLDFTFAEIPLAILFTATGPLAWIIGYYL